MFGIQKGLSIHLIPPFENWTKKCPKSGMFGFSTVFYSDGYCTWMS